ncbi:MAG: XRE family transcriptional regulator [Acidiferrobacterales bacterium]
MTYVEFRRQLGKAGLTVRKFGELIGMNPKTVTNYAKSGVVPPHIAVIATLMGEMAEHKVPFVGALAKVDIGTNRRGAAKGRFAGTRQNESS